MKRSMQAGYALLALAIASSTSCFGADVVTSPSSVPATSASAAASSASVPATSASATTSPSSGSADSGSEKMMWKPGQELSVATDTEDIIATFDVPLAQKQVAAYPDSPEASFILAVAMTRTSRVEEALKEVQRARRLAASKGGPAYFDKMIASYEKLSAAYPDDNKPRYELAWAYYMKAYLLGQNSRRALRDATKYKLEHPEKAQQIAAIEAAQAKALSEQAASQTSALTPVPTKGTVGSVTASTVNNSDVIKLLSGQANPAALTSTLASLAGTVGKGGTPALNSIPHLPVALQDVQAADVPLIRHLYEQALTKIDEILQREPNDVWATVYGAHLRAEYTGDLNAAMNTWRAVQAKNPNNPAPYFFLGEGFLKQGNLKESINHVSKAIALRALGN